ncbi:MAG: c-type cytochrome [Alphaproteobacteria bacterium]|nr:c-type cytochrome [Alphaproteobacteria bacterium]
MSRMPALALLAPAAWLAACSGEQSALAPRGSDAAWIADLAWLLFGGGGVVLAMVIAALVLSIRGPPAIRARLARPATMVAAGLFFPIVVLSSLLAYSLWLTGLTLPVADTGHVLRIEVTGEQWWWRVDYVRPDGSRVASANELHIPVGQRIDIVLRSADVIHSFWVPRLGGKVDMIPGRTTRLQLHAEEAGVYRGQCAEYCGGAHALMAIEVVAVPATAFEAWLARQAEPAVVPASERGRRGQDLFIAAGCGACHAVRDTSAAVIGPDLTHFGSRRSIGGAMLPMSEQNAARFIADGQYVKPGNRMPPFRIFSDDELAALSAFLVALR